NVGRSRVLAKVFGGFSSLEWRLPENHHPDSPFYLVNLPSEDIVRKIVNRSILVKGISGKAISFQEQNDRIKGLAYLLSRKLLPTYPFKSLKCLGLATLDAEMAFLMANQAQGAGIDLGQYLMVVVLTVMFGAISVWLTTLASCSFKGRQ
ncbi:hypothetical protein NC651_007783, partial [Populus alba x Populus x berolinensis]